MSFYLINTIAVGLEEQKTIGVSTIEPLFEKCLTLLLLQINEPAKLDTSTKKVRL